MKNIGMFYFTGTQSSYYVAKELKEALLKKGYNVKMFKLEKALNNTVEVDPKRFDMLGFVLPIYGFGSPRIAKAYVDALPRNNAKVFIIRTGCSNGWINKSASISLMHQLRKKWYDVFYDRILIVSSNWLLDMEEDVVKRLYEVTRDKKIPHIVKEITEETRRRHHRDFFREVLVSVIHFFEEQVGARLFGRSLWANKKCTKCRLCEKRCPVGNINFETGSFRAGWQCIWCMKCVYSCPENAIHSRGLDIVQFRNGFNYKWIINRRYNQKKLNVNKKLWKYMENKEK